MNETGSPEWVERFVRQCVNADSKVASGPVWLFVRPSGAVLPDHGWKLHVSSRVSNFPALVERLLPLLAAEGCVFKLARSQQALLELNDGHSAAASVGKAFTVYPDQRDVREIGLKLAQALRGHQGPRVLSDRRVSAEAPIYYRYGLFVPRRTSDVRGQMVTQLEGPSGEEFEGLAGLTYRQPSWVADPFADVQPEPEDNHRDVLLSGRYRVVAGIREAAQGDVYRAIDEQTNRPVIIKQARALVAEYGDGNDSRMRLRNDRRILQALDGVTGVPRFLDHFRYGDDEFLVTSDCGPRTLAEDVRQNGPFPTGPATGARSLDRLARELARILIAVHKRGVIMRDLSPTNVVIGDGASIIDFGFGFFDGVHLPGRTPGYAPARQARNEPPRDTDDFHTLGMTLLYAATGLYPVTVGDDPELARSRALQTVSRYFGPEPSGIMAAIIDLLDDQRARTTAQRIASGDNRRRATRPLPSIPAVTAETAAEVTGNLVCDLLDLVDNMLAAAANMQVANDVSVYSGTAGIGLELLHHRHQPAVARKLPELAAFTMRVTERIKPHPSLFTGMTGTDLFLQEAANSGISLTNWPGRSLPPPEWESENSDLLDGNAGIGLGHLYFYRTNKDPADLEVAQRCARAVSAERPIAPDITPGKADLTAGRGHGLAGAAELLLSVAEETGDACALETAADRVRHLSERARTLILEAEDPAAEPMTLSWCRGLSGIGQTLLHASSVLGDASLANLARQAADVCITRIPRLNTLGQCCGAAGIGNYLVNVAVVEKSERYWDAAHDVAAHLLLRSAGSPTHPNFFTPDESPARSLSWAQGLTGVLTFFRRLAHGGPDCLPVIS